MNEIPIIKGTRIGTGHCDGNCIKMSSCEGAKYRLDGDSTSTYCANAERLVDGKGNIIPIQPNIEHLYRTGSLPTQL